MMRNRDKAHISTFAVLSATLLFVLAGCSSPAKSTSNYKLYDYKVEDTLPHDTKAYTQGLFFVDGELYECAGQYRESNFRKLDLSSGEVLRRFDFDDSIFAEGACVLDGKLYILTWQEHECFVYDFSTWEKLGSFRYNGEGWGLTTDGKSLIMSNGTSTISFRDPKTFAVERSINVVHKDKRVTYINELEYIDGEIWANVYGTDFILKINPENGNVNAVINCTGILPAEYYDMRTDVLNGIAYDSRDGGVYITGKYWPKMYRITLVEKK